VTGVSAAPIDGVVVTIEEIVASDLVALVEQILSKLAPGVHYDLNLLEQARNAASSVACNFAEGHGVGRGRGRYAHDIARGEAYECAVACKLLGVAASEAYALARFVEQALPATATTTRPLVRRQTKFAPNEDETHDEEAP
jgi:four helix bundle protein